MVGDPLSSLQTPAHRRRSSRVWMVLSDWPSVWGWNVVLRFNFIPNACCKLGHNLDVNLGSRSDIIDTSTPWSLMTLCIYNFVNLSTKSVIFICKKKKRFCQLIHHHLYGIITLLSLDNPITKSIEIYVNISFPSCISLIAVSLSFVAVSILFFSFVAVSIFFFSY